MSVKEKYIELRKKIIRREFARMNDMQFQAVTTVDGPILILAGAGSGKTTVLINRISNMIRFGRAYDDRLAANTDEERIEQLQACLDGNLPVPEWIAVDPVRPWEILAITFTNKAARELKERLDNSIGEKASDIWAATFHSTCARILRRHADRIGFSNHFTIYSTDDQKKLVKEVMKRLNIDEKFLPVKTVINEISHAKDELIDPAEYAKHTYSDARLMRIAEVYKGYQAALREYDAMDFDDLITQVVRLFRENPDVLEYYQNRFKYVMIDEYQDTNHAQYMFAKLLAGQHKNICVVGDDDQSIYRFRGATIENILNFEKEYPNSVVIRLEQNYRSTQVILDAANAVIANNLGRKGKQLWTARADKEQIVCYTAANESDEARYVADIIQDNLSKGMKPSDHAILYRMNAQSNAIENVLARSGIPYRVVGGLKFFDRKEIRDVIAYLNLINNPADGVALMRVINEPKRGIGDTTVAQLSRLSGELGVPMLQVARDADQYAALSRSAGRLKDFADMIDRFSQFNEELELHELFEKVMDESGYLRSLEMLGEAEKDRVDNVNEFSSNILSYERENDDPSLAGFLEEIALVTDMDREDDEADRVWMMTMHTAKGLEFPNVFLVGVEEGIFPGNQTVYGTQEDMEEERRLAYVGITRAKDRLHITNAESRMIFGRTERSRPSRFIGEIPDELLEKKRSTIGHNSFAGFGQSGAARGFGGYSEQRQSYRQGGFVDSAPQKRSNLGGYAVKPKSEPAALQSYKVGEMVRHKAFGEGLIVSAVKMGNDVMLEIAFNKVGTKRVMSNFAKLEKI